MAVPYSDISPFAPNRIYLNGGEATYDRVYLNTNTAGTLSGDLRLTGFTALHTETCNNITSYTGGGAGATLTLCRMGVYQVDPTTGNLTLLAATANDPTLWTATNTRYVRPLTTQFNKVANTPYMLGWICVGTTLPQIVMSAVSNLSFFIPAQNQIPPACGKIQGQSDLPLTIPYSSYTGLTQSMYFMEVLP